MGSGDSGKFNKECAPLGQNREIVEYPLTAMIYVGSSLVKFHLGTMKRDKLIQNDKPVYGGQFT